MGDTVSGVGQTRKVRRRKNRQTPQQQPQQQRRTAQDWLNYFDRAGDSEASSALNEWRKERMDAEKRSNDTDVQRFFHNIGWSENVPVVLDEKEYQAALRAAGNPQQLYHSDKPIGKTTAQEYADQFFGRGKDANGNTFRHYISNGYFGGGTYFATSAKSSAGYGPNQFRGFLNSNARVVNISDLRREYTKYAAAHPAFEKMMGKVKVGYGGDGERLSIFAAMQGYNVIYNERHYYTVLDRRAITVSTKQKQTSRGMANW